MARWSDIATWRGPTTNQGPGGMVEHRGLVLHIAVGWYEGTISWQRNPKSRVSSHFVVGKERGELAQMVDTATRAWTQGDGNGRWISSENEGFLANDRRNPGGWEKLSPWQIEANAQILAKAHKVYGVPLAVAIHPGQKGLGHHSMDREWLDEQWGHDECPGAAIVAQKPLIVARAKEIAGGDDVSAQDVWGYDIENVRDEQSKNASTMLRYTNHYAYWANVRAKQAVAGQAAILAAIGGLDTEAILARIDQRSAEDAARDEALLELVERGESGELDAAEVVRLIGAKLSAAAATEGGQVPA